MANACMKSTEGSGAVSVVFAHEDLEREQRAMFEDQGFQDRVDYECVAQEDRLMKPDYGYCPDPGEFYEQQCELPDPDPDDDISY